MFLQVTEHTAQPDQSLCQGPQGILSFPNQPEWPTRGHMHRRADGEQVVSSLQKNAVVSPAVAPAECGDQRERYGVLGPILGPRPLSFRPEILQVKGSTGKLFQGRQVAFSCPETSVWPGHSAGGKSIQEHLRSLLPLPQLPPAAPVQCLFPVAPNSTLT